MSNVEKARKLMQQKDAMITDLMEALAILGVKDISKSIVTNNIVINKGKIVEVPVVKEIVKEVVKEVEIPVVKEVVKEVVVDNTDTATIEMLRETIKNMNEALNNANKENAKLMEELMKAEEDNMMLEGKVTAYEFEINRLKEKANKKTVVYVEDEKIEEAPKSTVKPNTKVSNTKKLVNCGPDEGEDEVLFTEKRRDSKHLWLGQIRIDNEIRNFHWSNELQLPTVYGVKSLESLNKANDLIRAAVKAINAKELTKYDMVPDCDPDFGGFRARHFYGALNQGAYIYMTPDLQIEDGKDTDVVYKGYVNMHAFIVNRSGDVFWRHYNYINSKKPFEKTPSKGFNAEQMLKDVELLVDHVYDQFENAKAKYESKQARQSHQTTKEKPQKVENTAEGLANADISGLF